MKKALLICERILHRRCFYTESAPSDYKNSSMREYINRNFLIDEFRRDFLPLIEKCPIVHGEHTITYDRMFVLSEEEAVKYFSCDEERKAKDRHGDRQSWWLRSQKGEAALADYVGTDGRILP